KLRWLATISGELANLARRAHSAAWARQYMTYDDITRSHTTRTAHSHITLMARFKLKRRLLSHHSYLCRGATRQEIMNPRPNFAANCCIAITHLRHRPTVVVRLKCNHPPAATAPFRAGSTVLTHATLMASDVRACCDLDHHRKA